VIAIAELESSRRQAPHGSGEQEQRPVVGIRLGASELHPEPEDKREGARLAGARSRRGQAVERSVISRTGPPADGGGQQRP
jgi:hypothetical protein